MWGASVPLAPAAIVPERTEDAEDKDAPAGGPRPHPQNQPLKRINTTCY